ncbi:MAG: F0F1 ATP synthase subunit A, partial [Gemmatimonadota bacterium]|nr:F0F1 ATP synthase subunit A [Gemmatimonadota bacterium]
MSLLKVLREQGQEVAEAAGEHGAESSGAMPMNELADFASHHIADAKEIEFLWWHWNLDFLSIPTFDLGPLTIDLSPTRHMVVMVTVAVLMLAFIPLAGALRKRYKEKAPSGLANAMEALIIYFRDDVVRANIGHGADAFTPFILTLFFFILGMNLIGL